ncbi:MAG: class I SAM-dependent methyltransferase [Leptolyngbyaceae cyanobacterium SL_7_1]|nr:class I SAM-dependent methyltransferase [Leptolyngbyaceae cyanobacterium SL_7_1]
MSVTQTFVNSEHTSIFERTKHLPGWQEPGDSFKLYEMGYQAGDVILEIGTFGGRSAVVELRGALANLDRTHPQFYGIDVDIQSIQRTANTLREAKLDEYALLHYGTLETFLQEFSIQPTMVFVDGDHRYGGVKRDLELLTNVLTPGTPMLCHDYMNPENDTGEMGVRQAVLEFVEAGYAELIGTFGCSAFLITSARCQGIPKAKPAATDFTQQKQRSLEAVNTWLYRTWQECESDRAARLDAIHQLQQQLHQAFSELDKAQRQLQGTQAKVAAREARIAAMESSKFWQLRSTWFKIKRVVGLGQNE